MSQEQQQNHKHRILPSGTVFTTISNTTLRNKIVETITGLQPNIKFQHFCSSADEAKKSGLKLINYWQHHKGDVPEDPVTFSFGCYITDLNQQEENDGTVMYSVFEKRIPVIRFMTRSASSSSTTTTTTTTTTAAAEFSNPLLQVVLLESEGDDGESVMTDISSYFSFPSATAGRVIVIEGGDGAGKQTQTAMLIKRLESIGKKVATIDFPHDAARYGVLIREGLAGHKGPLKDISPLVFASLYGLNRHDTKPWIDHWLLHGYVVVFDRWTTANYGHQASKFKTDEERDAAIASLRNFEVRWLGLPDADRVIYLDLPPLIAYQAMLGDASRRTLDLHEKAGIEYKDNVRRAFLWCCERFSDTWIHVSCWDDKAEARVSREGVHGIIWDSVKDFF